LVRLSGIKTRLALNKWECKWFSIIRVKSRRQFLRLLVCFLSQREQTQVSVREIAKVTFASSLGTALENFDFFIAGLAAGLVWPTVFFSGLSTGAALALSLVAFALTSIVRPVGAFLFGHFGDRMGRRTTLVWTLMCMGIGTFLIAILPGNAVIGVWAAILLSIFRIIQGLGMGGELGSAVSIVSEFAAKSKYRSVWNSIVMSTTPIGLMMGGVAFSGVAAAMSKTDFVIWGWRLIFVAGAVTAVVGLALRYKISESPLFLKVRERKELVKAPAVEVLKRQWFVILLMAVIGAQGHAWGSIVQRPLSLSYLEAVGVGASFASYAIALSAGLGIFVCILGGYLGDVIGRRWTMRIGIAIPAILAYPAFFMMGTRNLALIMLAQVMFYSPTYICYGNYASCFSEQFETKYRNSGAGLSYQLGTFINAMVTVAIIAPVLNAFPGPLQSYPYILGIAEVVAVIAFISTFLIKETKGAELT